MTPLGEDEHVLLMFAEQKGVLSLIARNARSAKADRLFIEPFHALRIEYVRGNRDLGRLRASRIETPRHELVSNSLAMHYAGMACRWVRALLPAHQPEPKLFEHLNLLLDQLRVQPSLNYVASFGVSLLSASGYGVEVGACVRCSTARPSGKSAVLRIDAAGAGGIICSFCRGKNASWEHREGARDQLLAGVVLDAMASRSIAMLAPEAHEAIEPLVKQINAVVEGQTGRSSRPLQPMIKA